MSIYKGSQLISGVATPVQGARNIGQIIQSTIPLTDAGLHLLDGALIQGGGIYDDFVDYISNLDLTADYFAQDTDVAFNQPTLSADGTIGGDSFACAASSNYSSDSKAWYAFDGNTTNTNKWYSATTGDKWLEFYNPQALNVTSLRIYNHISSSFWLTGGSIQASTDNSTWTTLATFTKTGWVDYFDVDLSSNTNYYKYYRIADLTGSSAQGEVWIREVKITATYQITAEEWWQQQVTTYGVCGKFVYDSVNNTVRLPKITGFTEGTITPTELGDLTQAGLPNHRHDIGMSNYQGSKYGERTTSTYNHQAGWGNSPTDNKSGYTSYASESNIIYGNSTTVQPQSIKVLYYIVIATSTKTDIEVDIDEIATDLNGKADVDLTNVNNSGTSRGAGWSMPSNTYIDLTLGASGTTYTAPANGYAVISKTAGSDWYYVNLYSYQNDNSTICLSLFQGGYRTSPIVMYIPVRKGQNFAVNYNATGTTNYFRFIYAQGSESEAQ